jgi:hypothetical protein
MLTNKKLPWKYFFNLFNGASILLLIVWLYKSCSDSSTGFTAIFMDFSALLTCLFSLVRVNQSLKGDFKVLDMVTVYYASLFFLFSWFMKMLYTIWDHFWSSFQKPDDFKMITSIVVFITLLINFYVTEKVNMDNLDKIEADL